MSEPQNAAPDVLHIRKITRTGQYNLYPIIGGEAAYPPAATCPACIQLWQIAEQEVSEISELRADGDSPAVQS